MRLRQILLVSMTASALAVGPWAAPPASAGISVPSSWRISTAGLGPLTIGMTIAHVRAEIDSAFTPRQLGGEAPATGQCFLGHVGDPAQGVSVLGTGFRVASVSITRRGIRTAKGVRVGDSVALLRRTYGRNIVPVRNFYVYSEIDWEYRRGNRKLIFFTAHDRVSRIDAGRRPEIDYVEGCA